MNLTYRPDIDGLRAIAVLAVLFFHAGIPGFSGGFAGVDIFFVISGFLITSIILKEIEAGTFSIARFYERRIRRIFPALFPVIFVTLIAGWYLFDNVAFKDLGQSIAATTLFSSNILFWSESGYFAAPSLQKPLLHTWSLAVEEQFYIFFPLLLVFISKYQQKQYTIWISSALLLSLAASIYGMSAFPDATFYLVPARAWELLVGAILAMGVLPIPATPLARNLLSASGIALIIYSTTCYSEATPFPGYTAIPPVLGSALILYSAIGGGTSIVSKLLSTRPIVFIGLISYSLYLWHWPIVTFSKYLLFRQFSWLDRSAIILASFALAAASWKFIEHPFRGQQPLLQNRKTLFAYAIAIMAITAGTGSIIHLRNGMEERIAPEIAAATKAIQEDSLWQRYEKWEKITEKIGNGAIPPTAGAPDAPPTFALWGDSHARTFIPAIEAQARKHNIAGYIITKGNQPPLQGIELMTDNVNENLDHNNNAIITFLEKHENIKTVILIARWTRYNKNHYLQEDPFFVTMRDARAGSPNNQSKTDILSIGLERTVQTLLHMNRKVVIVTSVPEIGYDVPRIYFLNARVPWLYQQYDEYKPTLATYRNRQREAHAILEKTAQKPGVTLIRTETRMFDKHGKAIIIADQKPLYRDDDHLATAGALFIAPIFNQTFTDIATKNK